MTRICKVCNIEKEFSKEFFLTKYGKLGGKICKECTYMKRKERDKNPVQKEKNKIRNKEYREANKERLKQKSKLRWERNRRFLVQKQREYYRKNRDIINAKRRKANNNDDVRAKRRKEVAIKRQRAEFRINRNMSEKIRLSIKKGNNSWNSCVGYSLEDLIKHLESKFKPGMTWQNYGKGHGKWEIDHIKPLSWFKFESKDDPAFKECWGLENLQCLWSHENASKKNRYEGDYRPFFNDGLPGQTELPF